jgi:hypothetical protein
MTKRDRLAQRFEQPVQKFYYRRDSRYCTPGWYYWLRFGERHDSPGDWQWIGRSFRDIQHSPDWARRSLQFTCH